MALRLFHTRIEETDSELIGPWRAPRQMLQAQNYDSHASIHDDATAQKLGFQGGTIEGPTHFSQLVPLCVQQWGSDWLRTGCISAHYRNPVFEGEEVEAILVKPLDGKLQGEIRMIKRDGTEVLRGTASFGLNAPPTALNPNRSVKRWWTPTSRRLPINSNACSAPGFASYRSPSSAAALRLNIIRRRNSTAFSSKSSGTPEMVPAVGVEPTTYGL